MDWLDAWKVSSVVIAGTLGIVGAVTETKTHGKITRWGKITIAGILISTSGGAIAQYFETANDAQKAAEAANHAVEIGKDLQASLAKTDIAIAKTDTTIRQVHRLFGQFGPNPSVEIIYRGNCNTITWQKVCGELKASHANKISIANVKAANARLLAPIHVNLWMRKEKQSEDRIESLYEFRGDPKTDKAFVTLDYDYPASDHPAQIIVMISGRAKVLTALGSASLDDMDGAVIQAFSSSWIFSQADFWDLLIMTQSGAPLHISRVGLRPEQLRVSRLSNGEPSGLRFEYIVPKEINRSY
jgi:hypothetical protein